MQIEKYTSPDKSVISGCVSLSITVFSTCFFGEGRFKASCLGNTEGKISSSSIISSIVDDKSEETGLADDVDSIIPESCGTSETKYIVRVKEILRSFQKIFKNFNNNNVILSGKPDLVIKVHKTNISHHLHIYYHLQLNY